MREYPLVEIKWDDTCNNSSWTSIPDLKNHHVVNCVTIGRLISKTAKEYKITATVASDGDILGYQLIPRGMVKSIKVIRI